MRVFGGIKEGCPKILWPSLSLPLWGAQLNTRSKMQNEHLTIQENYTETNGTFDLINKNFGVTRSLHSYHALYVIFCMYCNLVKLNQEYLSKSDQLSFCVYSKSASHASIVG